MPIELDESPSSNLFILGKKRISSTLIDIGILRNTFEVFEVNFLSQTWKTIKRVDKPFQNNGLA